MNQKSLAFLQGSGEMVSLTRNYDWASTPLGTPVSWPQSLRTALSILLHSRFPMFLFWGSEHICFYNDAYRPSLGGGDNSKHPSALGRPGAHVWQEIWPIIHPQITQVLEGGEATFVVDSDNAFFRNGHIESGYWTYSYSPVHDETGSVGGVFVVCTETTAAVNHSKSLLQSEHSFRSLVKNALTPICIFKGEDLVLDIANQKVLDIWQTDESALGKPLLKILPELKDQPIINWLLDVYHKGSTLNLLEIPTRFERKNGKVEIGYFDFVYQPYRDANGNISGVTAVANDVTDYVVSREKIEASQKQLLSLFDQSPVALATIKRENLTFTSANKFYAELVGRTEEQLVNKPLLEAIPEIAGQGFVELLNGVLDTGVSFTTDEVAVKLMRGGALETFYVNLAYQPMRDGEGAVDAILVVATDVTPQVEARRISEEHNQELELALEIGELGTFIVDLSSNRGKFNDRVKEWFGFTENSGDMTAIFDAINGPDQARVVDAIQQSTQDVGTSRHDIIYPITSPTATNQLYLRSIGKTFFDANGKAYAIRGVIQNVTAQRQSQQQIEESEARFRSLIMEAPMASCLYLGREQVIAVANQPMLQSWGKTTAIIGKTLREAMPELEGQPFFDILGEVFTTGKTFTDTATPVTVEVNGELVTYYFNFTLKPLRNAQGEVYGIINTSLNVSEQVLAQQKLEASEAKLRGIVSTAPAAIGLFVGRDLVIENPNQTFIDIVGKGWGVEGLPLREAMPELTTEGQPFLKILDDVFTTGVPFHSPGALVKIVRDGVMTNCYYNITYTPVFNKDRDVYAILDVAIDVTEQIEARQKVEEAQATLESAIEVAELGRWSFDVASNSMTFSTRLLEWMGIEDDITYDGTWPGVDADDRDRVTSAMRFALGKGVDGRFDEKYTITHNETGKRRIIHTVGRATCDAQGNVIKLAGTAQDITLQQDLQRALEEVVQTRTEELATAIEELKATNEDLADSNENLLKSNEELEQYAYVASHDLQEPLRKIRFFSTLLRDADKSPESKTDALDRIVRSTERMSLLINDLLSFSRLLNSEKLKRAINLRDVVQNVIDDHELVITEKAAQVSVGELPVIEGIALQLNQLFTNLVSNALKFTSPDSVPKIEIMSQLATKEQIAAQIYKPMPDVDYYLITVSDNGIGFDPLYVNQIFEVFKRLHGRSEYTGSGIGLAICRRVVNNHQGAIYAEAELGEGANFRILLPVRQTSKQPVLLPKDFQWNNLANKN